MEESSRRLEETRTREAIERARQTMRDGQAFLQKTLEQRRAREQEERERERGESERRLTAVLSLKRNIENSEVSFLHTTCYLSTRNTYYYTSHRGKAFVFFMLF